MCGIAVVVENAEVHCSSCGNALLSYQGLCPHEELADKIPEVGASEQDAPFGPTIQDLSNELHRRGPDGVRHLSIPLADVSRSSFDVSKSSADVSIPSTNVSRPGGGPVLHMIGAELQLRGSEVVTQPLEEDRGNVLVFNGEIFGGLSVGVSENDGQKLLEALQETCACSSSDVTGPPSDVSSPPRNVTSSSRDVTTCVSDTSNNRSDVIESLGTSESVGGCREYAEGSCGAAFFECGVRARKESSGGDVNPHKEIPGCDVSQEGKGWEGDVTEGEKGSRGDVNRERKKCERCGRRTIVEILSSIRGPWAIAYWQAAVRTLWYGRDFVGRRSLVAHLPDSYDSRFIISSVAVRRGSARLSLAENPVRKRNRESATGFLERGEVSRPELQADASGGLVVGNRNGLAHVDEDHSRLGRVDPPEERINQSQSERSNGSRSMSRVNEPNKGLASSVSQSSGVTVAGSTSATCSEKAAVNGPVNGPNTASACFNPETAGRSVTDNNKSAEKGLFTGPNQGLAGVNPGLESLPEGEALFDFWVDVPAGVYSYRPGNGAHAKHACEDPMVERLSRWQRERVEPPADVSDSSEGREADVGVRGEGDRSEGLGDGEMLQADVSKRGEGTRADVKTSRFADVSTSRCAGFSMPDCADGSEELRGDKTDGAEGTADELFGSAVQRLLVVLSGAVKKRVTGIRQHVEADGSTTEGKADVSSSKGKGGSVEGDRSSGVGSVVGSGVNGEVSGEIDGGVNGEISNEVGEVRNWSVGGLEHRCQGNSGIGADDGCSKPDGLACLRDGLDCPSTGLGCSRDGLICVHTDSLIRSERGGLARSSGCNVQSDNASTMSDPKSKPSGQPDQVSLSKESPRGSADVAVLFSGGLDSMVLAALSDRHVPPKEQIDLINVCFDRGRSPDRLSALAGLEELRRIAPGRKWHLIKVDSSLAEVDAHRGRLSALICPSQTYMDLNIGAALWLAARGQGVADADDDPPSDSKVNINRPSETYLNRKAPSDDLKASSHCDIADGNTPSDSRVPVQPSDTSDESPSSQLLDGSHPVFEPSTLLPTSEGLHDTPPSVPVDSSSPSKSPLSGSGKITNDGFCASGNHLDGQDCKDQTRPNISSYREEARKSRPGSAHQTDGKDCGNAGLSDGSQRKCASAARVLLVGSGADEQCAGYGRHRTKFREGGWQRLDAEMRLDVLRLWQRNLGRDDRCIADHGKEARFPFLDEDVMSFLLSLPLWIVADLRQPLGVGDKWLLRAAARALGIHAAAALPKRAIQFGSRIARASNRRDFGSNRAANASAAGGASFRRGSAAATEPELS